ATVLSVPGAATAAEPEPVSVPVLDLRVIATATITTAIEATVASPSPTIHAFLLVGGGASIGTGREGVDAAGGAGAIGAGGCTGAGVCQPVACVPYPVAIVAPRPAGPVGGGVALGRWARGCAGGA